VVENSLRLLCVDVFEGRYAVRLNLLFNLGEESGLTAQVV
jgi:hypothetical protein